MKGRAFMDVARDVVLGATEGHCRAAVGHAYYALLLECRDLLLHWGFTILSRHNVHHRPPASEQALDHVRERHLRREAKSFDDRGVREILFWHSSGDPTSDWADQAGASRPP